MLQVSVIHTHVQVCVPDTTLCDCESVAGCYVTLNEHLFSYIKARISYIFILLFESVESIE